jgi:GNAT superfamily N-acetyltransferase
MRLPEGRVYYDFNAVEKQDETLFTQIKTASKLHDLVGGACFRVFDTVDRVFMIAWPAYLRALPTKVLTTFYRRLALVIRPMGDVPKVQPSQQANVQLLKVEDAAAYYALQPHYYAAGVFEARIEYGEQCFGVFVDGRLVHTGWGTVKPNYVPYLRRDLIPRPGDVILFNNYTHPDYRKHGLAIIRTDYLLQYYRVQGYTEAIGLVAVENWVGMQVATNFGFREIGLMGCLRLGSLQWDWVQDWGTAPMPTLAKPSGPKAIH